MKNKHVFGKRALPEKKRFHDEVIYYLFTIVFLTIISIPGYGQSGEIRGKILDKDTKEPIPFANVSLQSGGSLITGSTSDFDGNYIIRHVAPGLYDLKASFVGYETVVVKGMIIKAGQIAFQDINLETTVETLETVMIVNYKVPLISRDKTTSGATVTSSSISKTSSRSANSIANTVEGITAEKSETGLMRSTRYDQTVMYINGVSASGSADFVKPETDQPARTSEGVPVKRKNEEDETITILDIISPPKPKHHVLTAGEINDFSKWDYWTGVANDEFEQFEESWGIFPQNRYCVQVMNEKGFPIIGCSVILLDESGNAIWSAKTDNTGKAELWKDIFKEGDKKEKVKMLVQKGDIYKTINKPKQISKGVNTVTLEMDCNYSNKVDVMFTVDATGSMGDEIDYLKAELENIISSFHDDIPGLDLRLGSVFYRCFGNEYVTRKSDFSSNINQAARFIKKQHDGEGGTEAVEEALRVSVEEMDWSKDARAKILFIILDEPPGQDPETKAVLKEQIARAAQTGIRIVPVVASGMSLFESDKTLEYLMRSMALATNGTYIFLTDDSGIGNAHAKPSIDDYEVELLNDLIIRLLKQYTYIEPFRETTKEEIIKADTSEMILEVESAEGENLKHEDEVQVEPALKEKIWLKAFPNPTPGEVTIEHGKKVDEVFVTDISGKILLRIETERNNATRVDLSTFPNGLYFLRYANVNHWEYAKIIVRH